MTLSEEHADSRNEYLDESGATMPTLISLDAPRRTAGPHTQLDGPSLHIIRGPQQGLSFDLGSDVVILGRSGHADIALDDTTVSRRHAEFRSFDGKVVVRDAGSLNGTYVNRRPISDEVELADGDEVWTGKYRMVFRDQ
jgi:pSer/pThr/pTyr-binding forkhead associated (FHA) protein